MDGEQKLWDEIPKQRRALPSSFGKGTGGSAGRKRVIQSTFASVTENTSAHSSVSQEDIFDIAYLDSCLQIFRLSPFLSEEEREKEKESAVVSKNRNFLWEHTAFSQKSLCKRLHWHSPAKGKIFSWPFLRACMTFFFFFPKQLVINF